MLAAECRRPARPPLALFTAVPLPRRAVYTILFIGEFVTVARRRARPAVLYEERVSTVERVPFWDDI